MGGKRARGQSVRGGELMLVFHLRPETTLDRRLQGRRPSSLRKLFSAFLCAKRFSKIVCFYPSLWWKIRSRFLPCLLHLNPLPISPFTVATVLLPVLCHGFQKPLPIKTKGTLHWSRPFPENSLTVLPCLLIGGW